MVFGRQVGRQNGPKIDSKKHGKKHAKKDQFFNALGGGGPRTRTPGHPRAEIFRPPKTLKSKKNTKPKTRYRYRYKYRYRYITKHEKNTLARLRASAVADYYSLVS